VRFLRRHPVVGIVLLAVLAVSGLLLGTGLAVWRAAHTDEARRVDHVDLIAVLGAAEYDYRPSPVLQGRLEHAIVLYERHFADHILTLGGKLPGDPTTEAEAGANWLVDHGVPAEDVAAAPVGNDTLQSVRAAVGYMRQHGLRTVFLVSDPWHNLRIRRMARDQGVQAYVSATWTSAARTHTTRFEGYVRETFAYLDYRLFDK
jgi:uncharacterized SAM-binding protein YcdF (DUF218 family)